MAFSTDDTICAIATAPGSASRGIVRISGPDAVEITTRCFVPNEAGTIRSIQHASAKAGHTRINLDGSSRDVPGDLFLWPKNRSYTRQPVAELHTTGSAPVLGSLLQAVCQLGARLAEPGEFTLRAFLAGRLDLTQAEAVLGVIDAQDNADLDAALIQLAGGLARPLDRLRDQLLQALAELEAGLDFVDEDIEFISPDVLRERLESAIKLLDEVAQQMVTRHVASDLPQVALVGPPNVGKSSLFNALSERFGCRPGENLQAPALVSPRRGTTRDYLTAAIFVNGIEFELVDTAGIDHSFDDGDQLTVVGAISHEAIIDQAAQSLASERKQGATIRAYCDEASPATDEGGFRRSLREVGAVDCDVLVLTKADMLSAGLSPREDATGIPVVLTSSRSGQGLVQLCEAFSRRLTSDKSKDRGRVVASTADRCRESVRSASILLRRAADLVVAGGGNELVAVELRGALDEVGHVVGAVYTDDLLDRIFGTFCIGK